MKKIKIKSNLTLVRGTYSDRWENSEGEICDDSMEFLKFIDPNLEDDTVIEL